jgi:ParB family transcriptional regulator, chromosome partitioning protein
MSASPQPNIVHLGPEQIRLRENARSINPDLVKQLAESISEVGLQSPIVVRGIGTENAYQLLAGNHRYEALRKLNETTIPAIIVDPDDLHAEIIVIDENLCRQCLTEAEEILAVDRRKQIYEQLHPETAHGGNRKSSRRFGDLKPERFTKATAAKTGRSERSVQRSVTRAEKIGRDALRQIIRTSLDKGSELDALAAVSAAERASAIERAVAGETVSLQSKSPDQSAQWRANFKKLMDKAPTKGDCEWAVEQARRSGDRFFPDIPPCLDRRIAKARS